MYFRPSISLSLILALSLNRKTSQVHGIIGDDHPDHKNTECALLIKHNGRFICSASLAVDDNGYEFALTSAKCLWNGGTTTTSHWPADHLYIYGWTPNFNTVEGIVKLAKKVVLHPQFDPRDLNHDIAVIILRSSYEQLPGQFAACKMVPPGFKISGGLVMLGYGQQSIDYETNGRLRQVTVPFVNHHICKNFGHDPNEGHFCVGWLGKGGVGPCIGDEGGPALARIGLEKHYLLAGIYSHSPAYGTRLRVSCTDARVPSVVTDIEKHLDWINEQVQNRNVPDK